MIRSMVFLFVVFLSAWLLAFFNPAHAFSRGSTVCSVNQVPFAPMSDVLAVPTPTGWYLDVVSETHYVANGLFSIQVRNTAPNKKLRGILIWANVFGEQGNGGFTNVDVGRFHFITDMGGCDNNALTHGDATPRTQDQYRFDYQAPSAGFIEIRAFVIEDCGGAPGACRAHQALTPMLSMTPRLFFSGFESLP